MPGPSPILKFIIGFMPLLTMLLGIFLAQKLIQSQASKRKSISAVKAIVYSTTLGVVVRAGIMPFIDYAQYRFLFPVFLGQNFSEPFVLALMPGIVLFNILLPLYGVSVGYFIAKTVGRSLKIGPQLF